MDKEFYSVKEFAKRLCVHPNTIRNAIKANRIKSVKTNPGKRGVHRIPATEIIRMVEFDLNDVIEKEVEKRIMQRMNNGSS